MTRKERIKTYLIGVVIGVALLIVWESVRSRSPLAPGPTQGVPSASDTAPSAPNAVDTPEAPRRTP